MNIPVDSIPSRDAIEAARNFITQGEQLFGDYSKSWADLSLPRGDFERIAKVLFVGIGELSK